MVKSPPLNVGDPGDVGLVPGLERFPGGGHSNPFQYSGLESSTHRGAWQAMVLNFPNSRTWLKQCHTHTHIINKLKMGSPWCLLVCFHVDHSNLLPCLYVNAYLNSKKSDSHHPQFIFTNCSIPVYMDNNIIIVNFCLHGKQLFKMEDRAIVPLPSVKESVHSQLCSQHLPLPSTPLVWFVYIL